MRSSLRAEIRGRILLCLSIALTLGVSSSAHAEGEQSDSTADVWPTEWVVQPLVLPTGLGRLTGNTLGINLTRRQAYEPVFSPLELYYGYSDDITLALLHDTGICWSGPCGSYDDMRLAGLYLLLRQSWVEIAGTGALDVPSFADPFALGLRAGISLKARHKKLGVVLAPEAYLGAFGRGSISDRLYLPIEFGWQFRPNLVGKLRTGWEGPLSGFSDAVEIPVGLGVDYRWTDRFEVGGEFLFENFFGRGATFDRRVLFLRLGVWIDLPSP